MIKINDLVKSRTQPLDLVGGLGENVAFGSTLGRIRMRFTKALNDVRHSGLSLHSASFDAEGLTDRVKRRLRWLDDYPHRLNELAEHTSGRADRDLAAIGHVPVAINVAIRLTFEFRRVSSDEIEKRIARVGEGNVHGYFSSVTDCVSSVTSSEKSGSMVAA